MPNSSELGIFHVQKPRVRTLGFFVSGEWAKFLVLVIC